MEEKGLTFGCTDAICRCLQLHIYAALAEQEKCCCCRTRAALAAAKERGVQLGAPIHHIDEQEGKGTKDARKVRGIVLTTVSASLKSICEVLNASGARTRCPVQPTTGFQLPSVCKMRLYWSEEQCIQQYSHWYWRYRLQAQDTFSCIWVWDRLPGGNRAVVASTADA